MELSSKLFVIPENTSRIFGPIFKKVPTNINSVRCCQPNKNTMKTNPIKYREIFFYWLGAPLTVLALLFAIPRPAAAQVPPPLFTSAPTFVATNHILSTTVFHWFPGQVSGPWAPMEGIANWTGTPGFWQGQIKQMMRANIDMLYVHQYADAANPNLLTTNFPASNTDQQLVNFFTAYSQLRAQGYDVPKIAPFLDPQITWNGTSIDLATTHGKDAWANQYIRFYNMYYSVNTDTNADDYLAKQSNKPILDTWATINGVCLNAGSLARTDVSSRLVAALGTTHPCFTNGFVQVGTAANASVSFLDEKLYQFENNSYHIAATYNGITTMQLKAGYWDQNIRTPGSFVARDGGLNYSNAWNYPDRATVQRANIESWNEYDEGTGIYAGTNAAPYITNGNTNSDTWSTTHDPFEYIKTTARGAATFNDTPAQGAKILWHNIPATLTPGETRTVTVIVRNAGDASWTAAANYKLGQGDADTVFVVGKRVLINDTQDEIPTYGGIFRGRVKVFQVTLTAPAGLGTYSTHWRMLQEGVTWFGEELVVPITVKTKTAANVFLSNLSQVADGTAKSVSSTTTPSGLTVGLTYNGSVYPPTSAGSYTAVGIIDDTNYQGRATNTLVITANPNLLANGSFEGNANGVSVTSPPNVVNSAAILGWRVFDVDSANVAFSATVINNASVGSRALRLNVTNSTGGSSFGLDQWDSGMHTQVQQGTNYIVSFDAAWIAGASANNLLAYVNEFNSSGVFIGTSENLGVVSVSATGYKTFTFAWKAVNPGTTQIGLAFVPMSGAVGATTVNLDNVKMEIAPLVLNGSFEFQADGTSVTAPPDVVDGATFTGWRAFDVNSAAVAFSATIISNASVGSHAMRLAVNNTTGGGGYALDQWGVGMHEQVQQGANYLISFDAAWIAGVTANNLLAYVNEFDNTGTYIGTSENLGMVSVSATGYKTFTFAWKAVNPGTTQIGLAFVPMSGAVGATTVNLDNVKMEIPATVPANGSFEYSPIGTSAALATPTIDSTTFIGWRLFSVGTPPITSFNGTIVDAGNFSGGQPGSHAMRLDVNNTGSPAGFDYALDTDNNRIPVVYGNHFTLSFDLELDGVTGGTMACQASIAEFDVNGTYLGEGLSFVPTLPTDQTFHHYSTDYIVQNPSATQVVLAFHPRNPGFVSALVLDNVVLSPYIPVANTVTIYRAIGSATQVKKAKIMSSAPLGLTFVTNAATTANGVTLTSDADTIYVPSGSVDDSFGYTINDGSYTNSGTVLVKVGSPTGLPVTAFPNGGFESDAYNTTAGYGTPFIDTVTFANWRLYTVGSPPIALFAGTIQDASSTDARTIQGGVPGSHCMRLDVNNPANPGGVDYGLDRDAARVSVTYGVTYTFSFDAALYGLTGGSFTLNAGIPEFNGAGTFTGSQTTFSPTLDGAYRTYSYSWTPLNPATATIAPAFRLYSPGFACAMGLDNVLLHAPVANTDTTNRASGLPVQVKISDLLANDTDNENHPLTFVGTSATTTNGSVLSNDGINITVPANTVNDSFTYKITDGLGATNFGTVLILVTAGYASTPTNIVFSVTGGVLKLTWPGSHLGWYAQSNSVNLADSSKWFNIPGSETVTNLNITIQPTKTNVFYRLLKP